MKSPKELGEKGTDVKRVKPKLPLESEILRNICEALDLAGYFFWRSNNLPSIQRFGTDGGMRMRSMPKYSAKGIADIIVVDNGKFIALEVKRPGAKLRPEQAEWGLKVIKAGGNYIKVTSVEEAISAIVALKSSS